MHGVVVEVKVSRGHAAEMGTIMDEEVVPQAWQLSGFVGASWFPALEGDTATAVLLFTSEQTARDAAEQITALEHMADSPMWSLQDVRAYNVLGRA